MTADHDDLLPLFLAEAGERLDRLDSLLQAAAGDDDGNRDDLDRIRRQLHALKGASRMMGLTTVAEACHRAESALEAKGGKAIRTLGPMIAGIRAEMSALQSADPVAADPDGPEREPIHPRRVIVAAPVLDAVTDRATRTRLLAVAAGGLVDRIYELAGLAEHGVNEPHPSQVLATLATSIRHVGLELEAGQRRLAHHADRQLEALLGLQIQPLGPFLGSLADHARQLAAELGRELEIEVVDGGGRLDRRIAEALREALIHLVRNAVDHGIEAPEVRRRSGKEPGGSVRLEAEPAGDHVRLTVSDDGRGIDLEAIRDRARELGLVEERQDDDPRELLHLLTRPGFTTRAEVTEISGRGIGLDAVAAAVRTLGGDVWLDSRPGQGTRVSVELPVARRGERIIVLRVGRHVLAAPRTPVRGFSLQHDMKLAGRGSFAVLERDDAPEVWTWVPARTFGEADPSGGVVVEMFAGGRPARLLVDEVVGEEEVLVRPFPPVCGVSGLYEGLAVLASGRPVPVLAMAAILGDAPEAEEMASAARRPRRPLQILLVDDSAVTRAMVRRLLEDAGLEVTSVPSGDEAWSRLSTSPFDCVVTDIEMPGLDGLELTAKIRSDERFAELPVVLVSTRDRSVDRMAGLDAGADAYLAKQHLAARELIQVVRRLGGAG